MMPANPSNPRGFFESSPLVAAHDQLLMSAGSRWNDWRELKLGWSVSENAVLYRRKIKALLLDEFGDESLVVIKDPRMCRFVPFVRSVLDELNISPVALIAVRNPLEVALSLKRRDGIALHESLLIWLRHLFDAEYYTRHIPRCLLLYDHLIADWRLQLDRVAEKTGIVWPARLDNEIEEFLTADLHHERASDDELQKHPSVTPLVRETYETLTEIVAHGESNELLYRLDLLRTKFAEDCDLFGPIISSQEEAIDHLQTELRARLAETEKLKQENRTLETEGRSLAGERYALVRAHEGLRAERDALLASNSWRLTAPLRWIRRWSANLRAKG